jgi:hypothetical protein
MHALESLVTEQEFDPLPMALVLFSCLLGSIKYLKRSDVLP